MDKVQLPLRWWCGLCFLAAVLASCASTTGSNEARAPTKSSTKTAVFAGVGTSLLVYDLEPKTGDLTLRQTVSDLQGVVQYAAVNPARTTLYVSCSETPPPKERRPAATIYAFAIDGSTGSLKRLGDPYVPPLSRAINITVDNTGRYLLMAHPITESVSVLRLRADGSLGEPVKQADEQQHLGFLTHQVRVDPSNKWVIVPVRGDDEKPASGAAAKTEPEKPGHLVVFDFSDGVLAKRQTVDFPTHLGPRHIDFHPSKPLFYVSMERGNRLIAYKNDRGVVTELFNTTTLANPSLTFPDQRAGAIQVHPSGKWLYVSNRNTRACSAQSPCDGSNKTHENDVAVFALDEHTGEPRLIQNAGTHGFEARTMALDPSLQFLIVGNQKEFSAPETNDAKKPSIVKPNLSVFRIGDDGKLSYVRTYDVTGGEAWWVGAVALP